jgi:hypothetical protein
MNPCNRQAERVARLDGADKEKPKQSGGDIPREWMPSGANASGRVPWLAALSIEDADRHSLLLRFHNSCDRVLFDYPEINDSGD